MPRYETTCWEIIEGAANQNESHRAEFARRYTRIVRDYLAARWRGGPLESEISDAEHDVFMECFREGGVLDRVDPERAGGFRSFFYGVIRNVARRFEAAHGRFRERQPSTSFDLDEREGLDTSLSRVLDRAWARSVLSEAGRRHRELAGAEGEVGLRRVELLRLRFEEGLPIREIAQRWQMDAAKVHQEYRRARREFRRCLEAELDFNGESGADAEQRWAEFIALLR